MAAPSQMRRVRRVSASLGAGLPDGMIVQEHHGVCVAERDSGPENIAGVNDGFVKRSDAHQGASHGAEAGVQQDHGANFAVRDKPGHFLNDLAPIGEGFFRRINGGIGCGHFIEPQHPNFISRFWFCRCVHKVFSRPPSNG